MYEEVSQCLHYKCSISLFNIVFQCSVPWAFHYYALFFLHQKTYQTGSEYFLVPQLCHTRRIQLFSMGLLIWHRPHWLNGSILKMCYFLFILFILVWTQSCYQLLVRSFNLFLCGSFINTQHLIVLLIVYFLTILNILIVYIQECLPSSRSYSWENPPNMGVLAKNIIINLSILSIQSNKILTEFFI